MPTPAMHAETTDDPTTLRWVVRGEAITGVGVIRGEDGREKLPAQWRDALRSGAITTIFVTDGALLVQASDADAWPQLAPALNSALLSFLSDGNTIHVTTGGRNDRELARAVQDVLDGPLADYVASHGGRIELIGVEAATVTVRLSGTCQGCPSASTTLNNGIEERLRARYPEIVGVRAVTTTQRDRRPLLPTPVRRFPKAG